MVVHLVRGSTGLHIRHDSVVWSLAHELIAPLANDFGVDRVGRIYKAQCCWQPLEPRMSRTRSDSFGQQVYTYHYTSWLFLPEHLQRNVNQVSGVKAAAVETEAEAIAAVAHDSVNAEVKLD
jgi:hypothetical protein